MLADSSLVDSRPGTSTSNQPQALPKSSAKPTVDEFFSKIKVVLLRILQNYIQRNYNGRIRNFVSHDINNFSFNRRAGKCYVKCPVCNKPFAVLYKKYSSQRRNHPQWHTGHFNHHLKKHF